VAEIQDTIGTLLTTIFQGMNTCSVPSVKNICTTKNGGKLMDQKYLDGVFYDRMGDRIVTIGVEDNVVSLFEHKTGLVVEKMKEHRFDESHFAPVPSPIVNNQLAYAEEMVRGGERLREKYNDDTLEAVEEFIVKYCLHETE
jgi:hypothetical protein